MVEQLGRAHRVAGVVAVGRGDIEDHAALDPKQRHDVGGHREHSAEAEEQPDRYLINMAKNRRTGRIFLDYLRNDRMSTAVAPLSPRMRPGAPVSMPVHWSQVRAGLNPKRFTIKTVPSLLAKSRPWLNYCDSEVPLKAAIQKFVGRK